MKRAFAILSALAAAASAVEILVDPEDDFEEVCLMEVQPGDSCKLLAGNHYFDGLTRTHGTEDARITIYGETGACLKGSNDQDRLFQIAHNFYTIRDLCFDGNHGDDKHVSTAIYILGADKADETDESHGVKSAVTGTQLFDLEIKNFDEECVHLRYFVTFTEMKGSTITNCGKKSFEKGEGGRVGEAVYIGTALDQTGDSKAPEPKLRSGGADNVDVDVCRDNWIHHNTFHTYGNECVDIKEGSTHNLIEGNQCAKQRDENSGCMGSRGSGNCFINNEIDDCTGACVRVGGDKGYGENNHIFNNEMKKCAYGAFNLMAYPQGKICGNKLTSIDVVKQGSEKEEFDTDTMTEDCDSTSLPDECKIDAFDTENYVAPADQDDDDDDNESESEDDDDDDDDNGAVAMAEDDDSDVACAGVNCHDDGTEAAVVLINTSNPGEPGVDADNCGTKANVVKMLVRHYTDRDTTTDPDNLFDGDLGTYFSVNRESTALYLELEKEVEVKGVSIGFFMKHESEERIQTFNIEVRGASDEDYENKYDGRESSGEMNVMQHFGFTPTQAQYIKIETDGNDFNNWSAFTQIEVCENDEGESNALFGGVTAAKNEIAMLAGVSCNEPTKLSVKTATCSGDDQDVADLFDHDYESRWSTQDTDADNDLDNGKIILEFDGDFVVSYIKMAFFDGDKAHQYFSLYKESANDVEWTQVLEEQQAEKDESLQQFDVYQSGVKYLTIVGRGNEIGAYTKISELEVYGCS